MKVYVEPALDTVWPRDCGFKVFIFDSHFKF